MTESKEKTEERFTVEVPIGDQVILVQSPTESQMMQLAHELSLMQLPVDKVTSERRMKSLDRSYRIVRSMIVNDDDKEWVEDSITDGTVSLKEIVNSIKNMYDEEKPKAATVRRGRQTRNR